MKYLLQSKWRKQFNIILVFFLCIAEQFCGFDIKARCCGIIHACYGRQSKSFLTNVNWLFVFSLVIFRTSYDIKTCSPLQRSIFTQPKHNTCWSARIHMHKTVYTDSLYSISFRPNPTSPESKLSKVCTNKTIHIYPQCFLVIEKEENNSFKATVSKGALLIILF